MDVRQEVLKQKLQALQSKVKGNALNAALLFAKSIFHTSLAYYQKLSSYSFSVVPDTFLMAFKPCIALQAMIGIPLRTFLLFITKIC